MKIIGRTGGTKGRDAVVRHQLRLGAAPGNDLRLEIPGVSRHHARITKIDDAYWLEDDGSTNGTFLNGLRVHRERVQHLDVITLGRDVDLIALESRPGEAPSPAREHSVREASIEILDGPEKGACVEIPLGELTLGRLAPSNVLFESPAIGRLHARIQRTGDHVIIQDLDSANGTFVNQRRIDEPAVLRDGDVIALAGIRNLTVHMVGTASPDSAAALDRMGGVVDQDWKTRLVWSAEELAMLEAERVRIINLAHAGPGPAAPAPAKAASQPSATLAATPGITVRAVRLSGPKGVFTLHVGQHRVGRTADAAVSIPDPQVSRNHATISIATSGVRMEDTNSANGTRVNGKDIHQPASLKNGDTVSFGDLEFKVELLP